MIRKQINKLVKLSANPIGSWAWNRLNLARDNSALRQFDFGPTDVRQVQELMARYATDKHSVETINWLVPYARHPYFAGIFTILRFADHFARQKGIQNRLVFYGAPKSAMPGLRSKVSAKFPALAGCISVLDSAAGLPPSDISIATAWDSAYLLLPVRNTKAKFYFVQDFEPLFYPAGATYGLAEASYRLGFWGIANTPGLGAFLKESYGMTLTSFQPAADPAVFYPAPTRSERPVMIFFYGRPRNARNGFMLGIEALKAVKKQFKEEVQIVSAGGDWDPSRYGAEGLIQNVGLLPTIEDVASLYRTCHIGLVFMFTKHPSYQPIEMMASGMAVVTNENQASRGFLRNAENSLLVEPTVSSVAEGISCLVRESIFRERLATKGLETAASVDWVPEIESVYEFLTGGVSDPLPVESAEPKVRV